MRHAPRQHSHWFRWIYGAALAAVLCLLPQHSSSEAIFGARVSHMTSPQGSHDPKLATAYWPVHSVANIPALRAGEESMAVTDGSSGKRYTCIIPNVTSLPPPPGEDEEEQGPLKSRPLEEKTGRMGQQVEQQRRTRAVEEGDTRKSPEEILDSMKGIPCSYKMEGWWTYEFCYKDKVRQLHLEPTGDGKADITMEFILGLYNEEASREVQKKYDTAFAAMSPEQRKDHKRFHAQVYSGGTPCDLTEEPRRTEVRFFCEDGLQTVLAEMQPHMQNQMPRHVSVIKSLKEAPTCQYEMHYISSILCSHRDFRTATPPVNMINCYELASEATGADVAENSNVAAAEETGTGESTQQGGEAAEVLSEDDDDDDVLDSEVDAEIEELQEQVLQL